MDKNYFKLFIDFLKENRLFIQFKDKFLKDEKYRKDNRIPINPNTYFKELNKDRYVIDAFGWYRDYKIWEDLHYKWHLKYNENHNDFYKSIQ